MYLCNRLWNPPCVVRRIKWRQTSRPTSGSMSPWNYFSPMVAKISLTREIPANKSCKELIAVSSKRQKHTKSIPNSNREKCVQGRKQVGYIIQSLKESRKLKYKIRKTWNVVSIGNMAFDSPGHSLNKEDVFGDDTGVPTRALCDVCCAA